MDTSAPIAEPGTVFDKTYKTYVDQVRKIDIEKVVPNLGAEIMGRLVIPLFGRLHTVSHTGVSGEPNHFIRT
ncbi:MAG: hypothetical protein ACLFUT_11455 [Desulfobacteraceae bacterium]